MKEITKEITKIETTGYEASDGTIFRDKDECLKYERTCNCVIKRQFNNLKKTNLNSSIMTTFEDCDDWYSIDINSVEDIETILKYERSIASYKSNDIPNDVVGKRIIVVVSADIDNLIYYGTAEEYLERLRKEIYKPIEN